jgi:hypothetical protein
VQVEPVALNLSTVVTNGLPGEAAPEDGLGVPDVHVTWTVIGTTGASTVKTLFTVSVAWVGAF